MAINVTPGPSVPIKAAQAATGTVSPAATASVTVTWDTPFPDGTYTVVAQVVEAETVESLRVRRIESVTAETVVVNVVNNALVSRSGTVHVIAVGA